MDKVDVKSIVWLLLIVGTLALGGEYLWSGFYWLLGAYLIFRFMLLVICFMMFRFVMLITFVPNGLKNLLLVKK